MERPRYDVFLSHMSGDKPAVEELARLLMQRGIEPWLDKWNLVPGAPWQAAIEKALSECASVAVCLGPGGTGPWQNEEMRAAIDLRVKDLEGDFRVIPVLLPGAERGERSRLPTFLAATTWVEFRDTLSDENGLHRLVCGIRGVEPGPGPAGVVPEGAPPYRGLQAFDVGDALFFFGREALLEWLLDKLRPARIENRFLAIIGPSGSGKSSLARAGLLAALKSGRLPGSDAWPAVVCRPGAQPLESLALALAGPAGLTNSPSEVRNLMRDLGEDARLLHLTTRLALHDAPAERRVVVLIDQFEEVFTLCSDERQRQALVDNLLHAATAVDGRTVVLLTLRADFYGRCAADPGLAAALSDRQILVGALTSEELRSAIERPAGLVGCELEPGLTALLLKDTQGQQGSLPLLQHALLELWNRRRARRLTVEAYNLIGGVSGALEKHAEGVYGSFNETEKEVCRKVFLRLVQLGEGTAATRRRLAVQELGGEENGTVVRRLTDARLLTTDGEENPTVELAHEALITGWQRFQGWIENDREALIVRRRLDEAATEWNAKGRDASFLLIGGRLAQAEEWAVGRPDEVNNSKREFLNASVAHRDEERRREIARARRLRLLSYGLAAGLVLAVVAAGFAFTQWNKSERQRRSALAQNLAQKVRSVLTPSEPYLGLLLAAESLRLAEQVEKADKVKEEEELRWALSRSSGRALPSGRINAVGTTPDLRFLVTAGVDRTARLWDLNAKDPATSGRPLVRLDEGTVSALTLTSDLKWLLTRITESAKARVFLRDLTSKEGPRELDEEDWLDAEQPFSPDGHWLVTHQAGKALLRDLRTHAIHPLKGQDLKAAVYSHDSRWLATAFAGEPVELRDLRSADPTIRAYELPGIGERTISLEFAPNGRWISAINENKTQVIWNLDPTGRPGRPVKTDFKGNIELLRFPAEVRKVFSILRPHRFGSHSPDNRWFITQVGNEPPRLLSQKPPIEIEPKRVSSEHPWHGLRAISGNGQFLLVDRNDQVFLIELTDRSREIDIHGIDPLPYLELGFDGSWIAGAGATGLFVWRRTPEGFRTVLYDKNPDIYLFALSPDGQWLVSNGRRPVSKDPLEIPLLWSLRPPQAEPRELTSHSDGVTALAFDPQGRLLATGGREGIVRRYDLRGGEPNVQGVWEPEASNAGIRALAVHPDGAWIAIADTVGKIVLWKSGTRVRPLGNRVGVIKSLAFSPDGRSLAGLSESGAAQLWRLEEELSMVEPVLLTEPRSVQVLAFSSDGRLVTAGSRGFLRWETNLDKLLKIACRTVGRNFTRKEWETHLPGERYNPLEPCPNLPPGE